MAHNGAGPYYLEAAAGNVPANAEVIHKFGHNSLIGATFSPISFGGVYRTPQVSGATQVRVKAGNTNDTAVGTGARTVQIEGINATGELTTEVLTTNGTSAGTNSVNSYIRIFRAFVVSSGTYASQTAGSHAADVVIENAAGTEDWVTINSSSFSDSQSDVGAYTVPKGKAAYITKISYSVDTAKVTSFILFKRDNILQTAAPYSPMRKQLGIASAARDTSIVYDIPLGPFEEHTDIGFMAKVASGTAEASVQFDILLRDKE